MSRIDASASSLTWQIGDITIQRVAENVIPIPSDSLVPGITEAQLAQTRSWSTPYFRDDGRILLSIHAFVVTSGDDVVVIDTCVGPNDRALPGSEDFPERLAAELPGGLASVTKVLCTHLHFDHLGWNTRLVDGDYVPTFPEARYLISKGELDYLDADDHFELMPVSLQPLLDRSLIDEVSSDAAVAPGIHLMPTPGHTPGHVSVVIESEGSKAIITGDMTHSPLQFAYPELTALPFDWDSDQARRTRRAFISDFQDSQALILGTHFAPPTGGYIRSSPEGAVFRPVDTD